MSGEEITLADFLESANDGDGAWRPGPIYDEEGGRRRGDTIWLTDDDGCSLQIDEADAALMVAALRSRPADCGDHYIAGYKAAIAARPATDPAGLDVERLAEAIWLVEAAKHETSSGGFTWATFDDAARDVFRAEARTLNAEYARLSVAEDVSPLGHGTPVPEEATLPSGDARVAGL